MKSAWAWTILCVITLRCRFSSVIASSVASAQQWEVHEAAKRADIPIAPGDTYLGRLAQYLRELRRSAVGRMLRCAMRMYYHFMWYRQRWLSTLER